MLFHMKILYLKYFIVLNIFQTEICLRTKTQVKKSYYWHSLVTAFSLYLWKIFKNFIVRMFFFLNDDIFVVQ